MFDPERFVAECDAAVLAGGGAAAVYELVASAIADPAAIVAALGEPIRSGQQVLHRSPRLTVISLAWPCSFIGRPHNHLMWAVIGVYGGREDNIFWRRCPPDARRPIEAVGAASLLTRGACQLPDDVIHSVTNPLGKFTTGIHVYGGDFFAPAKSHWDGEALTEQPLQGGPVHKSLSQD
jgi:predicted metal-dependent enzyme (double-stranded beta helix superfamily)